MNKCKITAIGSYCPKKRIPNSYFEEIIDTSDEWIFQRTGIKERRKVSENETNLSMSIKAVEKMCEIYNKKLDDVDMIICATSTSEFSFPNLASQIQDAFKIKNCGVIDIYNACAGYTYALILGNSLIKSKTVKKILIITSEVLSNVIDYSDRNSCILFGDASTSTLLEKSSEALDGILSSHMGSDGSQGKNLYQGSNFSLLNNERIISNGKINQNGRLIFRWVIENIPKHIDLLIDKSEIKKSELDWLIPHSANIRIIESICKTINFPNEKTLNSLEHFGNTSSCTIPLSIEKGIREGKIQRGQKILLYGFGGGMTHSGIIINWLI